MATRLPGQLRNAACAAVVACALAVAPADGAAAPTTRGANADALAPGASKTDSMPISAVPRPRTDGAKSEPTPTAGTDPPPDASPAASPSITVNVTRVAIALGIVLALIFAARWLVGRMFVGSRAPAASRAVKVLGRTALAPRQQVLLLQVGRRVIVVGESNGALTTLANLDDEDEVAALIGQLNQEQITRAASFGGLFGRAERTFEREAVEAEARAQLSGSETPAGPEAADEAHARSELSGLVDKVRSIRNQLGRE